jgi:hypothetical protein
MAFLDNSGDIILDAVLTDLGRKRMAEGNFRITQFALGDDEIDYSLYNPTHPSGSAYYDLEILQTPVFEAFTQTNANINYGLLSLRDDLLYIPTLIHNQATNAPGKTLYNNVLHVAVNAETQTALQDALTTRQIILNRDSSHYVLFETGINNNGDPAGSIDSKRKFINNQSLNDNDFSARVDNRFITGLTPMRAGFGAGGAGSTSLGPGGSKFIVTDGRPDIQFGFLPNSTGPNASGDIILGSINNGVLDDDEDVQLQYSAINGPRARALAFLIDINPELDKGITAASPAEYSLFGKTGQTLYGIGSKTFDFIDTIVYLKGNTTGANTQLIVRIIRRAS